MSRVNTVRSSYPAGGPTGTGADGSLRARLGDGRWLATHTGALGWLALAAALADLVTTWRVLADPGRREGNRFLAPAAEVDPLLAVGLLGLWTGTLVAVCWLDLGWVAVVAGWFTVVVHGVSGGLNNVLADRTGVYLVSALGGAFAMEVLFPLLGVAVGLAAARCCFERLPAREVGAFLAACALLTVGLRLL